MRRGREMIAAGASDMHGSPRSAAAVATSARAAPPLAHGMKALPIEKVQAGERLAISSRSQ